MKPELEVLKVSNYDRTWGPCGKFTDWVTESSYYSEKSLSLDEFKKVLLDHHQLAGDVSYRKYKQIYGDGTVLFRHVCEEVMY